MKLTIKVIFYNIILIFLVLLLGEYILYKIDNDEYPFIQFVNKVAYPPYNILYREVLKNEYYVYEPLGLSHFKYRKPILYTGNKKKPIILFGCSFAWGCKLKENQTFYYKLSKLMKRSVYNRALNGRGPQHMLYELKQEDFYKSIPEPEYIIYLYISNHILRIYKYPWLYKWGLRVGYNELKYSDTKYGLKEEHRLQKIPYIRLYNEIYLQLISKIQLRKNSFKLLEKHFLESKKEVEKHWKNVKFVIFDYESDANWFNNCPNVFNETNVEKLKQDGFIVIKTSELTDNRLGEGYYISKDDAHPNETAWDLITPLFVKKLQEYQY